MKKKAIEPRDITVTITPREFCALTMALHERFEVIAEEVKRLAAAGDLAALPELVESDSALRDLAAKLSAAVRASQGADKR